MAGKLVGRLSDVNQNRGVGALLGLLQLVQDRTVVRARERKNLEIGPFFGRVVTRFLEEMRKKRRNEKKNCNVV